MPRMPLALSVLLLLAFARMVAPAEVPTAPRSSADWAEAFTTDLRAARRIILENHPGPVDALNPGFRDWLGAGFERQLALADAVDSAAAYEYALSAYIAGFRDGHLNIRFDTETDTHRWPGFLAAWRDGAVVVYRTVDDLAAQLPVGSALLSCDGMNPQQLLERRVFDYQYDPAVPAAYEAAATRAFIDLGNPFARPPARCVFDVRGEATPTVLRWRDFRWDSFRAGYDEARGRSRPEAGIHAPADRVLWFRAPTFGPSPPEVAIYDAALARLEASRDAVDLVVFDLRGNNGGSSMWADLFADALWGTGVADEPAVVADQYVEWRASPGNLAYWRTVPAFIAGQFGDGSAAVAWSRHVLAGLESTVRDGRPLWRETDVDVGSDTAPAAAAPPTGRPVFDGTVVVLTNATCASACLDAMDKLSGRPGVVQLGNITASDTQYMEARREQLPSGAATLTIPIKVYRGRARPDGGYYTPAVEFTGLYRSDAAIEAWVLSWWRDRAAAGE